MLPWRQMLVFCVRPQVSMGSPWVLYKWTKPRDMHGHFKTNSTLILSIHVAEMGTCLSWFCVPCCRQYKQKLRISSSSTNSFLATEGNCLYHHSFTCWRLLANSLSKAANYKQTSMYHTYNDFVPDHFRDRPKNIILHCLDRIARSHKLTASTITDSDQKKGILKSCGGV